MYHSTLGLRVIKKTCRTRLFLSSGGELWSAGSNKFGELGIGKTADKVRPQKYVVTIR